MRAHAVRKILHPRQVFRIARGSKPMVENVFLAVEQNGHIGYGEGSPNAYYGESAEDVHLRLLGLSDWLKRHRLESFRDIPALVAEAWPLLQPSHAALCALDLALWDLAAKEAGTTVCELALGFPAQTVISSATLSLGDVDAQKQQLADLKGWTRLKLKVNADTDWMALQALFAATPAAWALDANASWAWPQAKAWLPSLSALRPALLEQPLSPSHDDQMPEFRAQSPCPVYADESCRTESDLNRLLPGFDGINIKLVKCGGLTPALRLRHKAREAGLKIMVGCMLESSLLIAAGLVAAQGADWCDLDGAWLLRDNPFTGLEMQNGVLPPSQGLGFGVAPLQGELPQG